jgi:hypothetical protein
LRAIWLRLSVLGIGKDAATLETVALLSGRRNGDAKTATRNISKSDFEEIGQFTA